MRYWTWPVTACARFWLLPPLTEAIGVIMGANIGTTVTVWLISLFGFKVSISAMALPVVS
jgi:Na+/phosphate symporter